MRYGSTNSIRDVTVAYFTKQSLKDYALQRRNDPQVQGILRKAMTDSRQARVFLSHSHTDAQDITKDDIEYARVLLASQGVDVYIDWLDPTMPSIISKETASQIKVKITSCDKFVVVATNNAVRSRWVPWELGYADHAKGVNNVAILALADTAGAWRGTEYFGLYQVIETTDNGKPGVFQPNTSSGHTLSSWLA